MVSTKVNDRLSALVTRVPASAGKYLVLVFRIIRSLAVNNISDRAMTLAGQAFTSILPIMLMLTTFPGFGGGVLDEFISDFEIADGLKVGESTAAYASFGVVGALMTLISATSLARALERMYVGVWGYQPSGWRGWWRWVLVIGILAVAVIAQVILEVYYDGSVRRGVLCLIGVFIVWTLAWVAVPRALMKQQFTTIDLWCLGAMCGFGVTAFMAFTQFWYASVFESSRDSFGSLGLVFSAIGWLFIYTAIIVVATILVQVLRTPPDDLSVQVVDQAIEGETITPEEKAAVRARP